MQRSHASWFWLTARMKGDTAIAWMTIRLSSPVRYGRNCENVHHKKALFFRLDSDHHLTGLSLDGGERP
jgi:hypothetical protein